MIFALAVTFLAGSASVVPVAARVDAERVWGNGTEWQVLMLESTGSPKGTTQPFYVIAPIDEASPQSAGRWGFGPHDSVMGVPPHRQGAGTGPCRVLIVVPGGNGIPGVNIEAVPDSNLGVPIVRAADLDGDGILEPLTSTSAVEAAVSLGLVAAFEPQPGGAPITFTCPVHPLHA
jgi:hypothetical protein